MKDDQNLSRVEGLLEALARGQPDDFRDVLHRDAVIHGFQDGLYIHADRPTFLAYVEAMSGEDKISPDVAWVEIRGRVGAACIIERSPIAQTTAIMTFLKSSEGWKVVSRTFVAEDAPAGNPDDTGVKGGPQVRLQ